MIASKALKLKVGTEVTVPIGRGRRIDRYIVGTVVKVEDRGEWGRMFRPAGKRSTDRLVVVSVDLGKKFGTRDFANGLVERSK